MSSVKDAISLLSSSKWEGIISIRSLIGFKDEHLLEGPYFLEILSGETEELKGKDVFENEEHDVTLKIYTEMDSIFLEFTSGGNVTMNGILNIKGNSISGIAKTLDGASGTFSIQKKL